MATKTKAHKHKKNNKVKIGGLSHVLSDDGKNIYFNMKWHDIKEKDGFKYIETSGGIRFLDNERTTPN